MLVLCLTQTENTPIRCSQSESTKHSDDINKTSKTDPELVHRLSVRHKTMLDRGLSASRSTSCGLSEHRVRNPRQSPSATSSSLGRDASQFQVIAAALRKRKVYVDMPSL